MKLLAKHGGRKEEFKLKRRSPATRFSLHLHNYGHQTAECVRASKVTAHTDTHTERGALITDSSHTHSPEETSRHIKATVALKVSQVDVSLARGSLEGHGVSARRIDRTQTGGQLDTSTTNPSFSS